MRPLKLLATVLVLLSFFAGAAFAKAPPKHVGLDPTFGRKGSFLVATPSSEHSVMPRVHLAVSPSNKSYVLQDGWLIAFGSNGRPDPKFGENGRILVAPKGGTLVEANDVAVDSQGRVLVVGRIEKTPGAVDRQVSGTPETLMWGARPLTEAFVIRYLPNGALDPTFGANGEVDTTFGAPRPVGEKGGEYELPIASGMDITVNAADQPVIAAKFVEKFQTCFYLGVLNQAVVARLNVDGTIDTSFGTNGFARITGANPYAFAVAPSGGWATLGGPENCEHDFPPLYTNLSVLTESGSPAALDPAHPKLLGSEALVVDPQGRILYNEGPEIESRRPRIIRLLADGDLDTSFGKGGAVNLKNLGTSQIGALAIDGKGRIIAGFGKSQLEIARISSKGRIETKFGHGGKLGTKLGSATELQAIAIDSKGRVVAAGRAIGGELKTGQGVGIARFLPGM
jgi:uncharacterized delta-60 repeat protein